MSCCLKCLVWHEWTRGVWAESWQKVLSSVRMIAQSMCHPVLVFLKILVQSLGYITWLIPLQEENAKNCDEPPKQLLVNLLRNSFLQNFFQLTHCNCFFEKYMSHSQVRLCLHFRQTWWSTWSLMFYDDAKAYLQAIICEKQNMPSGK